MNVFAFHCYHLVDTGTQNAKKTQITHDLNPSILASAATVPEMSTPGSHSSNGPRYVPSFRAVEQSTGAVPPGWIHRTALNMPRIHLESSNHVPRQTLTEE